ncbi:hypothetical protein [Falsiroseomonas sp.]|uniref:hypothetical protein n=1 Tax=Falsiroseomonas sp. TaxID=2870721 RepID=UPI0035668C1B
MAPDAKTPPDLVDALYFVQETSSPDDVDALLEDAEAAGVPVSDAPDATAADIAIDIWLSKPALLQMRHAQALAVRQQSFDYHGGRTGGRRSFPRIDEAARQRIEAAFDDWFDSKMRGRGSKLLDFRQGHLVWLLVRHGERVRREASHGDDGSAGTALYRPQKHDVLVYDEGTDEIAVHAGTLGEKRLYLRTLGEHLFGDEAYFPSGPRFTLSPLANEGAEALLCKDIPGIEAIRLVEYRLNWGGSHGEQEVRRATDIYAAAEARSIEQPITREPAAAVFKVKFADSARERRVTIRKPASARYERNDDGVVIEAWLRARGFLVGTAAG